MEEELDAKIEAAITEKMNRQAELSKLSDEERQKAELDAARSELDGKIAEFEREKVKFEAAKVLAQRNLPIDFVEYLIDADNEATLKRITTFESRYKEAIEAAVNERLKGAAPASSGKNVEKVNRNFIEAIRRNQIAR